MAKPISVFTTPARSQLASDVVLVATEFPAPHAKFSRNPQGDGQCLSGFLMPGLFRVYSWFFFLCLCGFLMEERTSCFIIVRLTRGCFKPFCWCVLSAGSAEPEILYRKQSLIGTRRTPKTRVRTGCCPLHVRINSNRNWESTLSLPSLKSTFSQPVKEKCVSDVVRIGSL